MRRSYWFAPVLSFLLLGSIAGHAQSTPALALEELATTDKFDDALRHLPASVQNAIKDLTKEQKAEVSKQLSGASWLKQHNFELRKAANGNCWELLRRDGHKLNDIEIMDTFISGTRALLRVKTTAYGSSTIYFVTMRLEENEWRLIEFGPWSPQHNLEAETFVHDLTQAGRNESAAITTLRTIQGAVNNYSNSYAEVGFPANLQALCRVAEGTESSPVHARLLDSSFAAPRIIKDGYEFRYTLVDPGNIEGRDGHYYITATPLEFGKTGTKTFYLDETGNIHFTTENREANENDDSL
jgi:hypothetical protein